MSEKKEYKWQVRPGGTIPSDALNVKHATDQKGSTSQAQSLAINKGGDQAPTVDMNSQAINHATSVPDSTFNQREFAKGEGKPVIDNQSFSVMNATNAPKPPRTINTVDKAAMVSNNKSGY
eukprot:m.13446 g.13446  ORF g.13446 m.13446 type:complete len:121 (+) comp7515_c0_seq1:92-454(+)